MKSLKIAVLVGVPLSCLTGGLAYLYWLQDMVSGGIALRIALGLTFLTMLCAFNLALNTDTGPEEADFESF